MKNRRRNIPLVIFLQIILAFYSEETLESELKILREAPRDPDKLIEILKIKQKEYEKAMDREDIERLVSEIEMFRKMEVAVKR